MTCTVKALFKNVATRVRVAFSNICGILNHEMFGTGGPDKSIRGVLEGFFKLFNHREVLMYLLFSEFVGTMDPSAPSTCLFTKHLPQAGIDRFKVTELEGICFQSRGTHTIYRVIFKQGICPGPRDLLQNFPLTCSDETLAPKIAQRWDIIVNLAEHAS